LGGIFTVGASELHLLVGAGEIGPGGVMLARFSERAAIDALADVLQRAFSPQPMSHRQLARWGAIGLYAMDRIGKFDGSEQREIISFCKGGSFWLRCGYG
jgi:hypothetical protein